MKKQLLSLVMFLLPLVANAYDIAVENADGVTIYYNYINDGNELEVTYRGSGSYSGSVVIPEDVTYMNRTRKVTSIGYRAFRLCHYLTSVTIPNSVTSIEKDAFFNCLHLTSVNIPNSITSIKEDAFAGCGDMISITIPNSVTSIANGAFSSCRSLVSINVESRNMKYDSRNNCNAIIETASYTLIAGCKNTKIPSSVTSIADYAFSGSGLTSITIPNSVTSIGKCAFQFCYGLTSITIPSSVTSIADYAFYECSGLTSITIPSSVTSIGNHAFFGWDLPEVISKIENPFTIGTETFSNNTFLNATLYVPSGATDKYKATEGWKKFAYIEEGNGSAGPSKCEKPTISYQNGKLEFYSATEGALCHSTITDTDITSYDTNEVQLGVTYNISVYATKTGYENSETSTATLCWIDVQPRTEGITNGVANVPAKAVMIQSDGDVLTIQGVDDGTQVGVYGIDGAKAGSAVSQNGIAHVTTSLQPGSIAIVKIGEKSVKVVMK